jgi:uncharacterized protein (UPF0548 family)
MKLSVAKPARPQLKQYLAAREDKAPTYEERFDTRANFEQKRRSPLSRKYDYDETTTLLGEGRELFESAKQLMRRWQMFPAEWTSIYPENTPIETGQRVAVLFRLFGLWWWNSSEIQYTIRETNRFGFAYGTLPGHVEQGEELFLVEMDEEEKVWYTIKAFSRPAYGLVRLVYPYARSQQRRFVRASMSRMKTLIPDTTNHA